MVLKGKGDQMECQGEANLCHRRVGGPRNRGQSRIPDKIQVILREVVIINVARQTGCRRISDNLQ